MNLTQYTRTSSSKPIYWIRKQQQMELHKRAKRWKTDKTPAASKATSLINKLVTILKAKDWILLQNVVVRNINMLKV